MNTMSRLPIFIVAALYLSSLLTTLHGEQHKTPIKIGVITSLEPLAAPWSKSANIGLRKAVSEINGTGGINGRRLQLIFEDDQFLPKNALSAYHKLRNVDKVDFVIGPQFDQTMAAVKHLANKDKQLLIQTIGTNPINEVDYGYIIHACPPDKFAGKAIAERIVQDGRGKITFIIPEESYSQNLAKFVRDNLEQVEYQWINYQPDITDYKPLLLKAKAYKPDALVFLFLRPDIAVHIYKTMRQLGIHFPIYTSESLHEHQEFISEVGDIADPTLYFVVDFDENAAEVKAFLKSLPEKPMLSLYAVVAYDTIKWLSHLIERFGTDNTKVKDALYRMRFKGLLTAYEFDKSGDHPKSDFVAYRVTRDGFIRDKS